MFTSEVFKPVVFFCQFFIFFQLSGLQLDKDLRVKSGRLRVKSSEVKVK